MIQDIDTKTFIQGIISGDYNENDVIRRCKYELNLMALFNSLLRSASMLIVSKGIEGRFFWKLSDRKFDFDNSADLRIYTDVEFVRLQNAMAIVCDNIEKPSKSTKDTIEDYIRENKNHDKDAIIKAIKKLVEGKKGKKVAVIIAAAVSEGYIDKPPFTILQIQFDIAGTYQAFNKQYNKYTNNKTVKNELDAAAQSLKDALANT